MALTDDADNYIVVERATGTVSATEGSDALYADTDYAALYKVTTASGAVTDVVDMRMDENGLFISGGSGGGGGSGTVTNTGGDLTANAVMLGAGTVDSKVMGSLGTSGQVLTSAGAGSPPTWETPSGGGSGTKTYAVFTPMTSQPPASNYATLDTRNSIAVLDFDDATEEGAFWVGIMPEGASLGSGLKVSITWMATSATSGNVRWGAKFERMNTDEDSDSFDTATEGHTATSGTSGTPVKTTLTCTNIDGITAQDVYRLWIYRDASDTTNDTVTGDAELIAVEVWSAV